jgi:hypothetical protein
MNRWWIGILISPPELSAGIENTFETRGFLDGPVPQNPVRAPRRSTGVTSQEEPVADFWGK